MEKTPFHEKYFKRSKRLQKCNNTYRLQVTFFGTEKKMPFYMKNTIFWNFACNRVISCLKAYSDAVL